MVVEIRLISSSHKDNAFGIRVSNFLFTGCNQFSTKCISSGVSCSNILVLFTCEIQHIHCGYWKFVTWRFLFGIIIYDSERQFPWKYVLLIFVYFHLFNISHYSYAKIGIFVIGILHPIAFNACGRSIGPISSGLYKVICA